MSQIGKMVDVLALLGHIMKGWKIEAGKSTDLKYNDDQCMRISDESWTEIIIHQVGIGVWVARGWGLGMLTKQQMSGPQ